jgi:hypothetical protein
MTYKELLNKLNKFTQEQLQMDITVQINGEFYPACKLDFTEELDALDVNHPFLITEIDFD